MNKRVFLFFIAIIVGFSITQIVSGCGSTSASSVRFVVKGAGQ